MGTFIPEAPARRAIERCAPGPGGCLISTYSIGSHGYAQVGWQVEGRREGGKRRIQATTAHRAAWVAHTGEQIPDGMTVDHLCHVRRCVNPEHLRLLDNITNATDNRSAGRELIPPVTLLGRYCKKGHPLLGFPSGQVACRPCELARARKKYPKRAARRAATAA
jgi:hypothetical protein